MKVIFWGTRGSLPGSFSVTDVREKIAAALKASRGHDVSNADTIDAFIDGVLPFSVAGTYGCNTACLELQCGHSEYLLCDAGSGIRDFSNQFMEGPNAGEGNTFHVVMSHLHWDHIIGFPFFAPAYIPGNRIVVHGYHDAIPDVFKKQMAAPCFPVPFEQLKASIEFDIKPPCQPFEAGGFQISAIEQNHPGKSYGYRFDRDGTAVVYSTDSEHKEEAYDEGYRFVKFFRNADLLVFDAQYSLVEATFNKAEWGHSSNIMGVELSARSQVKHLCMFHNEPNATDDDLDEFLAKTHKYREIYHTEAASDEEQAKYPGEITLAYDGLEISL